MIFICNRYEFSFAQQSMQQGERQLDRSRV